MTLPTAPFLPTADDTPGARFQKRGESMRTLRSPKGCAWDRKQTLHTLRPYILEEAYEVVAAIDDGDPSAVCDELGDLLLEVVFVAQVASDEGDFSVSDVTDAIIAKLVRRHPHVFTHKGQDGSEPELTPEEVSAQWDRIKAAERGGAPAPESFLDGIPAVQPALMRASRIGGRTTKVGFDWDDAYGVLKKTDEELAELRDAVESANQAHIEEELGDLLFTVANLARKLDVDPELALRAANDKFERRFRTMEQRLAERGSSVQDTSSGDLEREWQAVKRLT